jgi:ABC-2 type transport system ATP-binding protein
MLELNNISVAYGTTRVVDGVHAAVMPGELTVLVGPNGAGKTSLLNVLAGRTGPEEGALRFRGENIDPEDDPWRELVSYTAADTGVLSILTVEEQLELLCRLTGEGAAASAERTGEVLGLLKLTGRRTYRGDELSSGLTKRLQIGLGIARNAEVYLFDEPFNGLDAESVRVLQDILAVLLARKRYVLIASHNLHFLRGLPSAVWELEDGKLKAVSSKEAAAARLTELAELQKTPGAENILPWIP